MLRPGWAGGVLVVLVACAGCLPRQEIQRASGWLDRARGKGGTPLAPDAIVLQTTLIDQPAPDPYLTQELWTAGTVTNPLNSETAAILELNGLRVRLVTGVPPAKFLSLISSEESTLSPTARACSPGKPKVVPVNGPLERVACQIQSDLKADRVKFELEDVECGLSVTARPEADGRIRLWCEPQIQHGNRQTWLRPTTDGTAFSRHEQKPLTAYPTLGWDIVLGPDEYLLVGPTADPAGSLGKAFFFMDQADRIRQRVLVIKAGRANPAAAVAPATLRPTTAAAAQAGQIIRGSAE